MTDSKQVAAPSKTMLLRDTLTKYRTEIVNALPRHISPDRLLRIAMTSARKTPALLECTQESFLGAVIQCAQLGLEPDTPMGHGWLLPYMNNNTGKKEVNFQPGYRGLMDLVYRVANHPVITPSVVYEGDDFVYSLGMNPVLSHSPMPRKGPEKLTHAYFVAQFPDGRKVIWVMNRLEVEAVHARSKAKGFSPWKTDPAAMWMKSVIRSGIKYLPMSAELQTAVGLDEKADLGESQHNDLYLRPESAPILTKSERVADKMATPDEDPESFGNFK